MGLQQSCSLTTLCSFSIYYPRIEPDGQRPKVLIHGKACRKTANPKCAYDTSDTRAGTEVHAALLT